MPTYHGGIVLPADCPFMQPSLNGSRVEAVSGVGHPDMRNTTGAAVAAKGRPVDAEQGHNLVGGQKRLAIQRLSWLLASAHKGQYPGTLPVPDYAFKVG